jgi:DNA invertase Pin-like site-specific DNA recombinase
VLTIADDLHARGVGARILTGKLSGSYSPAGEGKFFFTMMAAFAELERDIIHERTMAGPVAARSQGRNGAPTVMDEDKLAARASRARGEAPRRSPARSASAGHRYTGAWPASRQNRAGRQPSPNSGTQRLFTPDRPNEPADSRWNYRLVVLSRPGCPARRPWFILRP